MTSYRGMDGAAGRPGVGSAGTQPPASAVSFGGSYCAGLVFEVTQGSCWFEGYWWWVAPSGGLTAAQKFCLWSLAEGGAAPTSVVPGTTVTSGTLAAGFNFVPLPVPVQLAIGSPYVAATGVNGNFPDTTNQFASGDPYVAGITNGPLFIYPDAAAASYGWPQSPFTTAVTDPAAQVPAAGNQADILWLDVQVTDTAPAGYGGSWRLWPNKYDGSPATASDVASNFVLATEIHLSRACTLNAIWYFSPAGAASLATWCGVYDISGQVLDAFSASPSWKQPDGFTPASAGSGWVRCAIPGGVTLPAGQYKAAYYNSAGTGGSWSPREYGYFATGAGASGITSGPMSAPPMASAATAFIFDNNGGTGSPPWTGAFGSEPGQGTFAITGPQYPYLTVDYTKTSGQDPAGAVAETFWADMEVTPLAAPAPAALQAKSPARPPAVVVSGSGWRGAGHSR